MWKERNSWERDMVVASVVVIFAFIAFLFYELNQVAQDNETPVETIEQGQHLNQRIKYHGILEDGIAVTYLGKDGQHYFYRGGEWCKL